MPTTWTEKQCADCGIVKPRSEYYLDGRGYANGTACKPCKIVRNREYVRQNPERSRESARRARKAFQARQTPEYHLRNHLKRYGITLEDYECLLAEQGGNCAICGNHPPDKGASRLSVDHDHGTGQVRGLLCRRCNTMLGLIESVGLADTVGERVAAYLGQNFG
jgi:hypothetical protein